MTAQLVETLRPEIERTIKSLNKKSFSPDPVAGNHFSKIVSVMSSAYKRHGFIIERAILEQLHQCPDFEAWRDEAFMVSPMADQIVAMA